MEMKLDHIGIVVSDIEHSLKYYKETYGFEPLIDVTHEPAHGVNVVFVGLGHGSIPMIELISPVSENSKVSEFLEKKGGGMHHLAYEVADIDEAIEHFKNKQSLILGGIVSGAGHKNTPTVWLYTSERNLVELIEAQPGKTSEQRLIGS